MQQQILATVFKPVKLKSGQRVTLCESCFIMFNKNMKCDYCYQVYYDASEDAQMDGKLWIECDGCQKWNHTDCEITLGTEKQFKEVALDLNNQAALEATNPAAEIVNSQKDEKPYWCLKCRKSKASEETKKKAELLKKAQKLK